MTFRQLPRWLCFFGDSPRKSSATMASRTSRGERTACEAHTPLEEEARHQHVRVVGRACEAHTLLEEEARHQHVRVVGRRCWKIKTSLTPRALRRSSFEPKSACPALFSWSYKYNSQVNPFYIKRLRKKHENCCIFDTTGDNKGGYSQSSRKNNQSDTDFFNPSFRPHKKWLFPMRFDVELRIYIFRSKK